MRPTFIAILASVTLSLAAPHAQAQSVSILQPLQDATVWGSQVTVRWTSDDAENAAETTQTHYHLFLTKGIQTELNLQPDEPIGSEAIHTTEESHTYTDLSAGTYTFHVALADENHVPLEPNAIATVQFKVRTPDERPTADLPNWLIVTGVGVLLLGAVLLTRTF